MSLLCKEDLLANNDIVDGIECPANAVMPLCCR